MSDIDFSKKMSYQRPFPAGERKMVKGEYAIASQFESDRGRIINSAAIRRLQQKTQVFPLERNSSVRSRLTHSMEVQQVGRYITKKILNQFKIDNRIKKLGLTDYLEPFESLVEMACLMHDIGNPPFGHFGEKAISDWFSGYFRKIPTGSNLYLLLKTDYDSLATNELKSKISNDLCHFEGNAQAIRLVYSLQKLNLTYAQVACILKYTRPAYKTDQPVDSHTYLMKKPGYYLAEEMFVELLWQELDMQKHSRYPLTYIMEAADDISYCIADLEDAVEKSILSVKQLYLYLQTEWKALRGSLVHEDDLFSRIVTQAFKRQSNYRSQSDQFFMALRVGTIGALVPYAAYRFIEHLPAIFAGTFDQAIIDDGKDKAKYSEESCLLRIYKDVAFKYVFRHEEVEQLELQGYRIISGLLDSYSPLLELSFEDFNLLAKNDDHQDYPIESRLFHKLSSKHRFAYYEALKTLKSYSQSEQKLWEFYYRARLIQDYISGMTDHYAYDEFRKLNVSG